MPQQQTQNKPTETIDQYLRSDRFTLQVKDALPDGMSPARFVQSAIGALIRNRDLAHCTRESVFKCLMDLTAMGLEPDGRRAHLIPFKENLPNGKFNLICTLIVDYKGIAECVRRNGDVGMLHCDVVGDNDHFVCKYGTDGKLEHIPMIKDRGKIWCVYSFVRLKNGEEEWDVMNVNEVEDVRLKSRSKDSKAWKEHWNEMAKKTVFRRHSKTLPLTPKTRNVVEYGEDEEFGFKGAVPAIVPRTRRTLTAGDDFTDLTASQEGDETKPPEKEPIPAKRETKPVETEAKAPPVAEPPPKEPTKAQKVVDAAREAQKEEKAPARTIAAASRAAAARQKAPASPSKELFSEDPEADNDADKLIVALHHDGIRWENFLMWIASTGALGQNVELPIPISELRADLLADCVQNYDANIEEFRRWEASLQK